ncbi:MAG: DUF1565 domain-containing protein [Bryobacteraceae bacterium]|nr:DUF1565 domain-containing protein [Bryobacteraceae bacterium]
MPKAAFLLFFTLFCAGAAEYHVSAKGPDQGDGSVARPFRTISAAARLAQPGDTITVQAGVYRERITPPRGGESDARRIVYRAAEGAEVVLKGSEVARGWKPYKGTVWKLTLPDAFFGSYNPYRDRIEGDWFTDKGRPHHTGDVYINGQSMFETHLLENVLDPKPYADARDQDASLWTWYTESEGGETHIYANFHGKDPNRELVEITVRDAVFYPDRPGVNYITVRGFRMSHAATQWAAPTAEQPGLIGTHWSKGWVIEDNVISGSKCACVTLGKERATGQNVWMHNPKKDGATHYNEVILRALEAGWSREKIGSHLVRNNTIFDCEQAGIAGSMGAVFSRIEGNHIHTVWAKRQFTGAEMGGIKLHGAIDVLIEGNRIHNAGRGLWLDWMTQGTRVTRNLLYDNTTDDIFVEVNHGPFLIDNNVLLSPVSLRDWSQGGAYAHNLMAGLVISRPEPNRWTPYHRAHSTALAGVTFTRGGDNRFFHNIFIGGGAEPGAKGTSMEGYGLWVYEKRPFPVHAEGNVYLNGARPHPEERNARVASEAVERPEIVEEGTSVFLRFQPPVAMKGGAAGLVTSERLGTTVVSELPYANPDGSPVRIDADYGKARRNAERPTPGPFESPLGTGGKTKLW